MRERKKERKKEHSRNRNNNSGRKKERKDIPGIGITIRVAIMVLMNTSREESDLC